MNDVTPIFDYLTTDPNAQSWLVIVLGVWGVLIIFRTLFKVYARE